LKKGLFILKKLRRIIFVFVIVLGIYLFLKDPETFNRGANDVNQKELLLEKKEQIQRPSKNKLTINLDSWIGMSVDELTDELGEPDRKDLSEFNYTSYVYMDDYDEYLVFGVENAEVVTVFGTGSKLNIEPFTLGDSYDELADLAKFEKSLTFKKGRSSYTFELTEEDIVSRPLGQINPNTFIQFYFDEIDDQLIAVRLIKGDTLLLQGSYHVSYRGNLPEEKELTKEELEIIDRNQEQQTVEITNVLRDFYGRGALESSEEIREVAFLHSEDMVKNNYFSHESYSGESLADRLSTSGISFKVAGENIASNYIDSLATVVGWINSQGHRDSLLNNEFTHIGVGVYDTHYTQNFIKK